MRCTTRPWSASTAQSGPSTTTSGFTWTAQREGRKITEAEAADLRGMLAVRGVLPAPDYDDEPRPGPRGLRGGGGRKQKMGMQTPRAKRCRASSVIPAQEHAEPPADAADGPFSSKGLS